MRWDEIIGQRASVELLRSLLRSGRIPHALLFHGPQGVGKGTVARGLAAALLCPTGGDEACGACESCRLAAAGSHPDLTLVRLGPKKSVTAAVNKLYAAGKLDEIAPDQMSREITVDTIRSLTVLAGQAPRYGRRRVFLIDPADQMNVEAQNALLKTLEEPPGVALLVLVASRLHLLLPTVRSRSFPLPFGPLRAAELARALVERGLGRDEALARAALAEGRPGRARALDLDELLERRERILLMLEQLARGASGALALPAMAVELAGGTESEFVAALGLLQGLLRDVARAGLGGSAEQLIHADLAPRLQRLSETLDPDRVGGVLRDADRLRFGLRLNLNRKLVAEALLAAIAGGPSVLG